MNPGASRAVDDEVLAMLDARMITDSAAVGKCFGVSSARVRTVTNRVRAADIAESGAPVEQVSAHYRWSE